MDVGLHIPNFGWPDAPASIAPTLASIAEAAEDGGVMISLMDHWFQMDEMASATDPMLDGYTALGFIAANTPTPGWACWSQE